MVQLPVIRILHLRSASRIRTAGLVGFMLLLDSGLHCGMLPTLPAPAAPRDVDDAAAAPLVIAEGRWAATWPGAGNLDAAARAAGASQAGLIMLRKLRAAARH